MLAAIAVPGLAAASTPEAVAGLRMADSALLADALSGQALKLSMRGVTVDVIASAVPAEAGCAALVSASASRSNRKWRRLYRWNELAWTGPAPDGATMLAFFEQEGHSPVDKLVFHPPDATAFREAAQRLATSCRGPHGESERIAMPSQGAWSGCYFARLPALQLLDSPAPPRAVLTLLSRETPEAELQLLIERAPAGGEVNGGDGWDRAQVAFTFADPLLKETRVASAAFALDAAPVAAEHTLAAYGDTRVRIAMDSVPRAAGGGEAGVTFYRQLIRSGSATLTLLDSAGKSRAVLHFDAGPALAAAREALKAADWSCAGAAPPPDPAAKWEPSGL